MEEVEGQLEADGLHVRPLEGRGHVHVHIQEPEVNRKLNEGYMCGYVVTNGIITSGYLPYVQQCANIFFWHQVSLTILYRYFHNGTAALQDHCRRCRFEPFIPSWTVDMLWNKPPDLHIFLIITSGASLTRSLTCLLPLPCSRLVTAISREVLR